MPDVPQQPIAPRLERFFRRADALYARLNESWQRGANRRTVLILIIGGFLSLVAYLNVIAPPVGFPTGELVSVEDGLPLSQVIANLKEQQVVRSAIALRVAIMLIGQEKSVRAGDYIFKEPRDLFSVARALSTGAYGLEPNRIRIPEGAMRRDMARIFEGRLQRFDSEQFMAKTTDMEGYLFPDTYFFLPNASEDTVILAMRQAFDAKIESIAGEIASSGKSLRDVVIMASILEREARIEKDRQMISGVLWRRLKIGMALQVDAVFLYTLGKGTYQLTTKDLTAASPYNTYKNKGLPPTAIGSPSLSSLRAAVTPIDKGYLYYLADRHGTTYYSKTYEEHLRKKRLYIGT